MKVSKLLLSVLTVAGLAASASAQTYVHIVGSTAFRAGVQQAIVDTLTASGGAPTGIYWGSSTFKKCSGAAISGTYNGNWVIVETYWTGSLAGDVDISLGHQLSNSFISFTANGGAALAGGTGAGLESYYSATPTFESAVAPDAAMSDSYVQSVADELGDVVSTYPGYTGNGAIKAAVLAANLQDSGSSAAAVGCVGIVPFRWVLGVPGTVGETATNITQEAARKLATSGLVNFSELTGNANDVSNYAVLVGRNEDSGTRIDSLSETQAEATTGYDFAPIQVLVNFNNNATTESGITSGSAGNLTGGVGSSIASVVKWPSNYTLNTEPNLKWSAFGHSGYYSGGDVANVLSSANDTVLSGSSLGTGSSLVLGTAKSSGFVAGSSTTSLIGYVGISDAATAIGNGAIALTYNGVAYSAANVENGTYSLWGYEHMYVTDATATSGSVVDSAINAIADTLFNSDADIDASDTSHGGGSSGGILYGNVKFSRTPAEGGIIGY